MIVGETSARTITNKTSASASEPTVIMSKNAGQAKIHKQQIVNINTNKVVVMPLNGLQSL